MGFRPPLFFVTGFFWLLLSAALGLALFLGMLTGKPLPPVLRVLHVHGALVGGVAQMILGGLLGFIPPLLLTGRDRPESHPGLFATVNLGAVGMLAGFGLGRPLLVGAAGLLIVLSFLAVLGDAVRQARASLVSPPLGLWFYGVALVALLLGLGMGEAMALQFLPSTLPGQGRLAHIHLNLLGFVTLTIIGTMHTLYPTVLNAPLFSPRLARWTFFLLPAGIAVLIGGFLATLVPVQIAGGAILVAGTLLYAANILQTWLRAGRPSQAASDHFLLATFFLFVAVVAGVFVSINSLWNPPALPFGKLHLIAYTHLALVGFVLQTVMGALSHLLPIALAVGRVKSNKRRGAYLAELTAQVQSWHAVQLGALNLGIIGLALVATLVWQFNMSDLPVRITGWISAGLLGLSLTLFGSKVIRLLLTQPPGQTTD
ncbi:MAG: cbb3-type cytochrome c oxidase subunit I [Nitrospirota bacterium]